MRNLATKVPNDLWTEFKARATANYQAPSRAITWGLATGVAADYSPGYGTDHTASAGRTRSAISAPRSRSTRAMSYWHWRPIQNGAPLPK